MSNGMIAAILTGLAWSMTVPALAAVPGVASRTVSPDVGRRLSDIGMAWNLADWARLRADPSAMVTAARVMLDAGLPGTAPESAAGPPSVRTLLAEARALSRGDPSLGGEIDRLDEVALASATRGAPGVPVIARTQIRQGGAWSREIEAQGGEVLSLLALVSRGGGLRLVVRDEAGAEVCRAVQAGMILGCEFTPRRRGRFRAQVSNTGAGPAVVEVVSN